MLYALAVRQLEHFRAVFEGRVFAELQPARRRIEHLRRRKRQELRLVVEKPGLPNASRKGTNDPRLLGSVGFLHHQIPVLLVEHREAALSSGQSGRQELRIANLA